MIALLVLLILLPLHGLAWTGECIAVTDGDTITVLHDGKPEKVRLHGIDCPEADQPFGHPATEYTKAKAFGRIVKVESVTRDRYGRTVGGVLVGDRSLSHELLRAGFAWWFWKYAPRERELAGLEAEARAGRRGGKSSAGGGTHNVSGYHKKDGTYVAPHRRTNPNDYKGDNWTTRGNVNPDTGEKGSKSPY
ncbi:MAG: thermonuclease family protein [Pseudomonadota bacterium]